MSKNYKQPIREKIKSKRDNLSVEFIHSAHSKIKNFFLNQIILNKKFSIAGYSAIRNEVDILDILKILHQNNHNISLPKIIEDHMEFLLWDTDENLISNIYKIKEPLFSNQIVIPDIILAPLLACDTNGNRVGYGKGYYDKYLNRYKTNNKIIFIGICYDFQILPDSIPNDKHDIKLDLIISEERMITVNNQIFLNQSSIKITNK